jgi:aryl-alcohol dehydrogenase-like predicted oxidoreductase
LEILDHSGAVETLFNLKEQGLVRSIGISTKTVEGGLRAIELGLDAVMVTYNPWHLEEEAVLDAAGKSSTSVFLKKTFGSGWLGDKNASADPVAEALGFVFSHPATTSAVVGTINPKHLRENCKTLERVHPN